MNGPGEKCRDARSRQCADAGYVAWFASLPDDDWSDAVDPDQTTPLSWVDGQGWRSD